MNPELREQLKLAAQRKTPQDTFSPMGRVCPMHYQCVMTVERVK